MNSKELMMNVLEGRPTDAVPVTPHWWGLYKFQLYGLLNDYTGEAKAWSLTGKALAQVEELFYNTFRPDMLHLGTGSEKTPRPAEWIRTEHELRKAARDLESKQRIDEYIDFITQSECEILNSGVFDHVALLNRKLGDDVFIAVNEGPTIGVYFDVNGYVGFEEGLIGLVENPENSAYYIYRVYESVLPRIKAVKESGAHGYICSETYCSADIMSPRTFRELILPAQQYFYKEIKKMGLITIAYFTGDMVPMLEDIKTLELNGLMVEESKKGFRLDVGEIAEKLDGKMALFGNLDSVDILQKGTVSSVREETLRQLDATKGRRFIMANGCPISFDTPQENIAEMIKTVRNYKL